MNTIKLIKAELERRITEDYNSSDNHDDEIAQGVCASLIAFLDTLSQEKPSEDLKEELDRWRHHHFAGERDGLLYSGEYLLRDSQLDIARHFAEWQKNKMLEGAINATVIETTQILPGCGSYTGEFRSKEIHLLKVPEGFKRGEKVKVIIVKED